MLHDSTAMKRMFSGMLVLLVVFAACFQTMPVLAASPGIYTATATSHYRHPTTGVIEDSGGESSYVLGQSMTDSALNKSALVEVDSGGTTWVTVRLNLMDNIQSPQFQVDGSTVSATLMQEDYTNNTADFRMQVNSENSVIRCNMYVIPMGREVIFYITVGGLTAGSGDFITTVTLEQTQQTNPQTPAATSSQSAETPASSQAPSASATSSAAQETVSVPETSSSLEVSQTSTVSSAPAEEESGVLGLEEFDASGNEVTSASGEAGYSGSTGSAVLWWVIGGIVVVALAGGAVWYIFFFRKGKKKT